jgi:hypothetical protein
MTSKLREMLDAIPATLRLKNDKSEPEDREFGMGQSMSRIRCAPKPDEIKGFGLRVFYAANYMCRRSGAPH